MTELKQLKEAQGRGGCEVKTGVSEAEKLVAGRCPLQLAAYGLVL